MMMFNMMVMMINMMVMMINMMVMMINMMVIMIYVMVMMIITNLLQHIHCCHMTAVKSQKSELKSNDVKCTINSHQLKSQMTSNA